MCYSCSHGDVSDMSFPVLRSHLPKGVECPRQVPWDLVSPHEARARTNHSQSLIRLRDRGGLSPRELWAVVHDKPWAVAPPELECVEWLARAVG